MLTVFFPGLGADSTLAKYHPMAEGESLWIEWPVPIPSDWDGFVEALMRQIPSDRTLRFVGISFGGLAAMATARRLAPEGGVCLVGSLRETSELRTLFRLLLRGAMWLPTPLFDLRWLPDVLMRLFFGLHEPEHLALFRRMASRLPARSVKGLCLLLRSWQWPAPELEVRRIHGRRDRIIRAPSQGAVLVDGGHLVSMTNPVEINNWLEIP